MINLPYTTFTNSELDINEFSDVMHMSNLKYLNIKISFIYQ